MGNSIDVMGLKKLISDGRPLTLLDVRRQADYVADPGKIPEATWRDPEKIETWIHSVSSQTPIVVYCARGGSISQSVADRLQREGRTAMFLVGGLKAWTESNQGLK